jgi:phosphoglycolate phosphatase-like HAD superfamily hydrolase
MMNTKEVLRKAIDDLGLTEMYPEGFDPADIVKDLAKLYAKHPQDATEAYRTVCVDYNGVLDMYEGWKGVNHFYRMRPGADQFLKNLKKAGYRVVIYTAAPYMHVMKFLKTTGLYKHVDFVTGLKIPAIIYIDDRAICFDGSFDTCIQKVNSFSPHWKPSEDSSEQR